MTSGVRRSRAAGHEVVREVGHLRLHSVMTSSCGSTTSFTGASMVTLGSYVGGIGTDWPGGQPLVGVPPAG